MFRLRLLLLSAFAPLAVLAAEDDDSQTWPSPGQRFTMERRSADNLGISLGTGEPFPAMQLATYTLRDARTVLWSGVSWTDSSAHSFRCLWLEDAGATLILDRPSRADVNMCLVRTGSPAVGTVLPVGDWVEKAVSSEDATSPEHLNRLTKAWFGEWRVQGNSFEGVLIVTHGGYHRIHLVLDAKEAQPALRLKAPITMAQQWDDAIEKL